MVYRIHQQEKFVDNLIVTMKESVGLVIHDILVSGDITVVDEEDFLVSILDYYSKPRSSNCMDIWLDGCQNK